MAYSTVTKAASSFDSKAFLKTAPHSPGVYQMFDAQQKILYVGKARNLKKRLQSYFRTQPDSKKTAHLMSQVIQIEVTVTTTETEALLLESNLIKARKPRYNILLRDDKSYPYLVLTLDHKYPRLDRYRGTKKKGKRYFGPFPSAVAVRQTLHLLQKVFKIRSCKDSYFRNRSRPCLQYQINRCSAPCVNKISAEDYQKNILKIEEILQGKGQGVIDELISKMQDAAVQKQYETAAQIRDQIASLRRVQAPQAINSGDKDLDVIAVGAKGHIASVVLLQIRSGQIISSQRFFPKMNADNTDETILSSFISQYYFTVLSAEQIPSELIVNVDPLDSSWLEDSLSERAGRQCCIHHRVRAARQKWLTLAEANVKESLLQKRGERAVLAEQFQALQASLELPTCPSRIVCFDVSHTQGEATIASCVVFTENGPDKQSYRRFNIEGITGGDDYAAMKQALTRYFSKVSKQPDKLPDILLVDGGKGQLTQAAAVLEACSLESIYLLGIAKGEGRKAEFDTILLKTAELQLTLQVEASAKRLLQSLRDEAHRFAITGHRKKRDKARLSSTLERVPGIGPAKRQELLKQFGGLQEVSQASVEQLMRIPGISQTLATLIHDHFLKNPVVDR